MFSLTPFETWMMIAVLCACIMYLVIELPEWKKTRRDKMRISHKVTEPSFYERCCAFITAIKQKDSYYELMALKMEIDDYMGSRPVLSAEISMCKKVYDAFYERKYRLAPKLKDEPVGKVKIIQR